MDSYISRGNKGDLPLFDDRLTLSVGVRGGLLELGLGKSFSVNTLARMLSKSPNEIHEGFCDGVGDVLGENELCLLLIPLICQHESGEVRDFVARRILSLLLPALVALEPLLSESISGWLRSLVDNLVDEAFAEDDEPGRPPNVSRQ